MNTRLQIKWLLPVLLLMILVGGGACSDDEETIPEEYGSAVEDAVTMKRMNLRGKGYFLRPNQVFVWTIHIF